MQERDINDYTAEDLKDPSISPTVLQQMGTYRRDLWPQVLEHPNCYPALTEFIQQQQQVAPQPQAQPQQPVHEQPVQQQDPAQPVVTEQQSNAGSQPSAEQPVQGQPAQGQPGQQPEQAHPTAAQQAYAGSGANAQQPQQPSQPQQGYYGYGQSGTGYDSQGQGFSFTFDKSLQGFAQLALIGIACIGIISLFLPVAKVPYIGSVNFFTKDLGLAGEGSFLLISFLIVIAFAVVNTLKPMTWARITLGVVTLLVSLIAMFDGFANLSNFSDEWSWISRGPSLFVLGFAGVFLLIGGVIVLLPKKNLNDLVKKAGFVPPSQNGQPVNTSQGYGQQQQSYGQQQNGQQQPGGAQDPYGQQPQSPQQDPNNPPQN